MTSSVRSLPWTAIVPHGTVQETSSDPQVIFRQKVVEATQNIASMIQGKKASFTDVIAMAAKCRNKIAAEMDADMSEKFGQLRTDSFRHQVTTPMQDSYADIWDRVIQFSKDDSKLEWEMYSPKEEDGICMGVLLGTTHEGKKIKLSKFSFSWEKGHRFNAITHTSPSEFALIYKECQYLFDQLNKSSPQDAQENIAKIHWWCVQGTFWFRGTAAIMEIVTAAMKLVFEKNLDPWKEDVFPDHIALSTHLDEFVKLYPTLREST